MKSLKTTSTIIVLITLVSCLKSDVCECTTYDSDGEARTIVSQGNLSSDDCDSQETYITSNGDTNTIICQVVRR